MIKISESFITICTNVVMRKNENWLLQEDPKYLSRLCTAWKQENDVDVLDLGRRSRQMQIP